MAKGDKKHAGIVALLQHTTEANDEAQVQGEALAVELPAGGYDLGQHLMGVPIMHRQGFDGSGVVVGVIDSGIAPHPYLAPSAKQRDYVQDGLPPEKWHPHGTHVAGTIAAKMPAGEHPLRYGVAPGVTLHDYRVLNAQGYGEDADVIQAIRDAVADGCHIISMSLGCPDDNQEMHKAVRDAVAAGVLVVVAVGNEGAGHKSFPGYYAEVVGTGAVMLMPANGHPWRAWFSNSNDEVDVCAPGVNILSTMPGGGWGYMSGTSMAAPHVAGFAAQVRQKLAGRLGTFLSTENGGLSEPLLYGHIKGGHTADVGALGIDASHGAGFVTAYPAMPTLRTVEMTVGTGGIKVDGVKQPVEDRAALSQWGSTYVPVRPWSQYLGVRADWNEEKQTIKGSRINLPGSEM